MTGDGKIICGYNGQCGMVNGICKCSRDLVAEINESYRVEYQTNSSSA